MFRFFLVLILTLFVGKAVAQTPGIEVLVNLSPAGSFKVETSRIKGAAISNSPDVLAKGITVDMRTLKTGNTLRDKHTKERLQVDKYPTAKLVMAKGKDGKGSAVISLMGQERSVEGDYKIIDNRWLVAKFKMSLQELEITNVRYMGVGAKDEITVQVTVPLRSATKSSTKQQARK